MKGKNYITDLYETRNRLFNDVLGFIGNEWMAFEVMAAGKAFTTDKYVATIMTMDKDHYIHGNGDFPYKIKLQKRTEAGKLEMVDLVNTAITDEFSFAPATTDDVKTLLSRAHLTGAPSQRLLLLEAGLYEAVCYRLLISFDTAASPVRIVVFKADVWRHNVTWMSDFATTCRVEEGRSIIDEYGRKTWNAAMDYSGITDNPYD